MKPAGWIEVLIIIASPALALGGMFLTLAIWLALGWSNQGGSDR